MKHLKGIPIAGKKLATLRKDVLFYSQEELAPLIGMTKNNLSRIESAGVAGMNRKSFRTLAGVAKLEYEELLKRIGGEPGPKVDVGAIDRRTRRTQRRQQSPAAATPATPAKRP